MRLAEEYSPNNSVKVVHTEEGTILRDVKMLGNYSKSKKRRYLPAAMKKAAELYVKKPVRANHYLGKEVPKVESNLGVVLTATYHESNEEVRGDILLNPHNRLSKQIAWDAEHSPNSLGVSHLADGRVIHKNGSTDIVDLLKVDSVDIVSRPSTTKNLYESESEDVMTKQEFKEKFPEAYQEILDEGKAQAEEASAPLLAEAQTNLDNANALNEQLSNRNKTLSADYVKTEGELQALKESAKNQTVLADIQGKLKEKGLEPTEKLVEALLNQDEEGRTLLIESMGGATSKNVPNVPSSGGAPKSDAQADCDAVWG
jgi:hypothetical protein